MPRPPGTGPERPPYTGAGSVGPDGATRPDGPEKIHRRSGIRQHHGYGCLFRSAGKVLREPPGCEPVCCGRRRQAFSGEVCSFRTADPGKPRRKTGVHQSQTSLLFRRKAQRFKEAEVVKPGFHPEGNAQGRTGEEEIGQDVSTV